MYDILVLGQKTSFHRIKKKVCILYIYDFVPKTTIAQPDPVTEKDHIRI